MTKDEITRMAQKAGLIKAGDGWTEPHRWGLSEIERFAALVAAHEREACALMVMPVDESLADAIRERSNA